MIVFFFQSDCRALPRVGDRIFFSSPIVESFQSRLFFRFESESDRYFIGGFVQRVYDFSRIIYVFGIDFLVVFVTE
jgi:hypothetical protein